MTPKVQCFQSPLLPEARSLTQSVPLLSVNVNITPLQSMNAAFAKRVTGGEELTEEEKKQIQYQQKVCGGNMTSLAEG